MKKVAITAACMMLGGMVTVSMAGGEGCGKGKKSCGGDEGETFTVNCGGEKKGKCGSGEGETLTAQIGDFTVFCGGDKKKGCGSDDET